MKAEARPLRAPRCARQKGDTAADWARKIALERLLDGSGCDPEMALLLLETDPSLDGDSVALVCDAVRFTGRTWG